MHCLHPILLLTFPVATPVSGNYKCDLLFYEFVCWFIYFWSIIYLHHCANCCYTTLWFNIYILFKKIITIILVTVCHHTKILVIDYIPHTVYFKPVTHLFCTESLYSLISHIYFFPSLNPLARWLPICSLYESVSVLLFVQLAHYPLGPSMLL